MTEKEKRDNQQLYDANYDKELIQEMQKAKDLCFKYNNIEPSNTQEREKLIRQILGKAGKNILIQSNFYCDYGYNIEIGDNFYMNHNGVILDGARVEFGDNVTIGAGSIVTKDIPSNVIVVGNPCKVIKNISLDVSSDKFYSKSNINSIGESIKQLEEGKTVIKTMGELKAMENE